MYIIKLNHLINIYIDLIYYLKQRYICYAYISFNSKIYDILHMVAVREDDLKEIIKNIEGNLKEDAKSGTSEEGEIPLKEKDNLNES